MPNPPLHLPVLLDEVLELLKPQPGEVYADGTLGRGGHAEPFSGRIGPEGVLIGVDLDEENLTFASERIESLPDPPRIVTKHASFVELGEILGNEALVADMLLVDLGFSSTQMDDPARGFSFRADGPLDMRYDYKSRFTPYSAAVLVNESSERELADLIFRYGEEPFARRIARKLVEYRQTSPIETTETLARLVRDAYGSRARDSRTHPATRTFMALRIAVNDELGALDALLESIGREAQRAHPPQPPQPASRSGGSASVWLAAEARIGIISFHSLEDRRVKNAFRNLARDGAVEILTKKPVIASDDEREVNPRSRSAKLRVVRLAKRVTPQ